jgi:hypothetical protein
MVQAIFRHGARTPVYTKVRQVDSVVWPSCTFSGGEHDLAIKSRAPLYGRDVGPCPVRPHLLLDARRPAPEIPTQIAGQWRTQLPGGCRAGQLTDLGCAQALALGERLRETYAGRLAGVGKKSAWDESIMSVRSTCVPRCVASAQFVLRGLFRAQAEDVPIGIADFDEDTLFPNGQRSEHLAHILALGRSSWEKSPPSDALRVQALLSKRMPAEALTAYGMDRHKLNFVRWAPRSHEPRTAPPLRRRAPGQTLAPSSRAPPSLPMRLPAPCARVWPRPGRMRDVLVALEAHGLALPFGLDSNAPAADGKGQQPLVRQIDALATAQIVRMLRGGGGPGGVGPDHSAEAHRHSLGIFMAWLLEDMGARALGHSHHSLRLFSAHDTTLLPLLMILGVFEPPHADWPQFASCIALELWELAPSAPGPAGRKATREPDDKLGVRVLYQFEDVTARVPGCPPTGPCSLRAFRKAVAHCLPGGDGDTGPDPHGGPTDPVLVGGGMTQF